jgi:hypothetical protein
MQAGETTQQYWLQQVECLNSFEESQRPLTEIGFTVAKLHSGLVEWDWVSSTFDISVSTFVQEGYHICNASLRWYILNLGIFSFFYQTKWPLLSIVHIATNILMAWPIKFLHKVSNISWGPHSKSDKFPHSLTNWVYHLQDNNANGFKFEWARVMNLQWLNP